MNQKNFKFYHNFLLTNLSFSMNLPIKKTWLFEDNESLKMI